MSTLIKAEDPEFFMGYEPERIQSKRKRHLPQWEQAGATYFVTFRLADSLPLALLKEWKQNKDEWLRLNPMPWGTEQRRFYQTNFPERFERWLDQGMGSCRLKNPANQDILSVCLCFRDGIEYFLGDWVIMPNHVHLLVRPLDGFSMPQILKAWKGVSARRINELSGESGSLWMDESFTHIVRNFEKLKSASEYIRQNPIKAQLSEGTYSTGRGKAAWFSS